MILKDVTFDRFKNEIVDLRIVCVGAGKLLADFIRCGELEIVSKIVAIYDNKPNGDIFLSDGRTIEIKSLKNINYNDFDNSCILITSMYCHSLVTQLNEYSELEQINCYIYPVMSQRVDDYSFPEPNNNIVIPKKIHWFWFGDGRIPEDNQRCIDSWKRYCPDYEIIKWTENSYDITRNDYMKCAYEKKKWGFVPDYARLDVVYNEGGIYLDTDVELCASLDDLLKYGGGFAGFQRNFSVALGLGFGAVKGNLLIKEMRDMYDSLKFNDEKGKIIPSPVYQTNVLLKHGLKCNNSMQIVDGMAIFPTDVFDPKGAPFWEVKKTKHTHSIHHFSESWVDKDEKAIMRNRYKEVSIYR